MSKKSSDPLVSVVLPFFNASYLESAIYSILDQSFKDFELILVDNGSTDSSVEVADQFVGHPQVRLIKEPQQGVVHAANTGIEHAKGAFLARMDADDLSYKDRLLQQVTMLEQRPELGGVSGLVKYGGDPLENEGFARYVHWVNSIQTDDQVYLSQFIEFPLVNPTLMVRKNVFDRVGSYTSGNYPEDYEFFLRMMQAGVRLAKVPQVILEWNDLPDRLTRTDDRYSSQFFYEIKAKYLADWLRKNNPHHPNAWIWGAGRLSRRRSDRLKSFGIHIVGYIDFKENDKTISYQNLPDPDKCFILSYVGNRGARGEIRAYLIQHGFQEGYHFILAS